MPLVAPVRVAYAGFWLRFIALCIDSLVLSPVVVAAGLIFFFLLTPIVPAIQHADTISPFLIVSLFAGYGLLAVLVLAGSWLYFALMESSTMQATLGKKALGLAVTDLNGTRVSFARASGRYFGKLLSGMLMNFGYLMAAFTERKQALHDLLAGCLVIRR